MVRKEVLGKAHLPNCWLDCGGQNSQCFPAVQGNDAVEWQLLLYKSNCTYSKSSVICAAYFISKAEEKMKENEGISCGRLKMRFIFERRIQQLRGNRFFKLFFLLLGSLNQQLLETFVLFVMLTHFQGKGNKDWRQASCESLVMHLLTTGIIPSRAAWIFTLRWLQTKLYTCV